MEHLDIGQIEKYESIISKIDQEHNRHDILKNQIAELNSKIIATGITSKSELCQEKVFKVVVKIFSSVFDFYDLYSQKISRREIEKLSDCKNSKFYLVLIYVSRSLQEKIIKQNWLVNVCVRNSKVCVNKNVNLKNKVLNPICAIVPFGVSTEECTVEACLAWPSNDAWPFLKMASIPITILHHAESYSDSNISENLSSNVISITRLYNSRLKKSVSKLPLMEYKLPCNFNSPDFFNIIVKNCYHKLDCRNKSVCSNVNSIITIKILAGGSNLITIKLDSNAQVLHIEASAEDLYLLKKYFINEIKCASYSPSKKIINSLSIMKKRVREGEGDIRPNARDLISVYNDLRKLLL